MSFLIGDSKNVGAIEFLLGGRLHQHHIFLWLEGGKNE